MNELIAQALNDFSIDAFQPIFPRDLDLGDPLPPKAGNLVKAIVGIRRCGKSCRLFQEIDALERRGIPRERICYFDFDDERLRPITSEVGDEVLETFYALHPNALTEGAYFFFDELQEMEGWGAWLRRVVATRKATIYVSGSSSKMLSTEIATEFRGRALDFELLPFSFGEYAVAHDLPRSPVATLTTEQRLRLESSCRAYLQEGGFPATFDLPRPQAIALLQSYAQRVVARDVVERHNLARPRVATLFAQRLLGLNGRQLSLRSAAGDLKAAGVPTTKETLGDLLAHFQEAYLAFTVKELSFSLAEHSTHQPKVYAIDPGMALANAKANSNDFGQRLENAVYLELRRRSTGMRREAITSFRTKQHGYEVDFTIGDALDGQPYELYQVSADVADETTYHRELRALWEALEESDASHGTLIVGNGKSEVLERAGKRIIQVPAWKWLLETA